MYFKIKITPDDELKMKENRAFIEFALQSTICKFLMDHESKLGFRALNINIVWESEELEESLREFCLRCLKPPTSSGVGLQKETTDEELAILPQVLAFLFR